MLIKLFIFFVGLYFGKCAATSNMKDVLILGGGFSGIGAAKHLQENGIDFLVLEAKDRIGGRVRAEPFAGKYVPKGAGWIHNSNENHIVWKLAKKYNLTVHKDDYSYKGIIFKKGRKNFPLRHILNKFHEINGKIDQMDSLLEKRITKGRSDMDVKTGMRWAGWVAKSPLEKAIEYFTFDFENGIEPDVTSATSYGMTGEGIDYIVTDPRGYEYMLEEESKEFKDKILLNQEVIKITKDHTYKNLYSVRTTKGMFYAKKIIVTFSSGVLMSENVKFVPKLPPWKMEALTMVPMSHYCKIFLRFEKAFWDKARYIMIPAKQRGRYVHWQNFKLSTLFPKENILMVTITGDMCAEHQLKTDAEVISEVTKVLKMFYLEATAPIEILRSKWSLDKHVLGAYSYQVPGITEDDYVALEHPIDRGIWFTGEYTGRINDYGYTHGAYDLGNRMAAKLVRCMKNNECPSNNPKPSVRRPVVSK